MAQGPPKTRPARSRTRPLPRAQRRAAILAGATRAFAKGGFAATSMEEIAASCGVTAAIVYRHFASKEELYRAVLESIAVGMAACVRDPVPPFGIDFEAFLAAARRDPDGFELFWRHAAREPQFRACAEELREQAVAAVARALAGRVAPALLDWIAHATVGFAVEGALNWLRYGDPQQDARIVAATDRALHAGVRAWAETESRGRRSGS